MKTRYVLMTLLMLMSIAGSFAQSNGIQLEGTWEVDYERSLKEMTKEAKAHRDSLPAVAVQQLKEAYEGRKIAFSTDGAFQVSLTNGMGSKGSWHLDKETEELEITIDSHVYRYRVARESAKQLKLDQITSDSSQKLYRTLYFNKQ
jgi:hypothetical protein